VCELGKSRAFISSHLLQKEVSALAAGSAVLKNYFPYIRG
jgi:hypothetical protein